MTCKEASFLSGISLECGKVDIRVLTRPHSAKIPDVNRPAHGDIVGNGMGQPTLANGVKQLGWRWVGPHYVILVVNGWADGRQFFVLHRDYQMVMDVPIVLMAMNIYDEIFGWADGINNKMGPLVNIYTLWILTNGPMWHNIY